MKQPRPARPARLESLRHRPPLTRASAAGEHFIIQRAGIEFQAKDSFGRKFSGKVRGALALSHVPRAPRRAIVRAAPPHREASRGPPCAPPQGVVHVSTVRIVFVCGSGGGDFQSFDIPMANVRRPRFRAQCPP